MTTAHRPTWAPAIGGEEQGGNRMFVASKMLSAKDLPAHKTLKLRQPGQASSADVAKKDLRAELEEKERKHYVEKKGFNFEDEKQQDLLLLQQPLDGGGGRSKSLVPKALDADESDPDDSDDDSEDDSDEDEEAMLKAELERIKKEREEEAAKKAREEDVLRRKAQEEELIRGNPLIGSLAEPNFAIKRRWDDDVVFRNQASREPKQQKRFINDTIRNDFHRRFLERYIK